MNHSPNLLKCTTIKYSEIQTVPPQSKMGKVHIRDNFWPGKIQETEILKNVHDIILKHFYMCLNTIFGAAASLQHAGMHTLSLLQPQCAAFTPGVIIRHPLAFY